MSKAIIALEDGTIFQGKKFAGSGEAFGEIVFNTSMTGYQEILTDPSYCGQIVTMTYPLIGNYGVNEEDCESRSIFASGLIVSEYSRIYNNWRAKKSLAEYLEEYDKIGIHEIDTRAITLHIRDKGAMKCIISTENDDVDELIQKAKSAKSLNGIDLASTVSTDKSYKWASIHDQKKYNFKSMFIGKNFVFDRRMSEKVTDDVIGKCHICNNPADNHVDCNNDSCHILFIQCEDCNKKLEGCCSEKCKDFYLLPKSRRQEYKKDPNKVISNTLNSVSYTHLTLPTKA